MTMPGDSAFLRGMGVIILKLLYSRELFCSTEDEGG